MTDEQKPESAEELEHPTPCPQCYEMVELHSMTDCEWCKNLVCEECTSEHHGQTVCWDCKEHHTGRRRYGI